MKTSPFKAPSSPHVFCFVGPANHASNILSLPHSPTVFNQKKLEMIRMKWEENAMNRGAKTININSCRHFVNRVTNLSIDGMFFIRSILNEWTREKLRLLRFVYGRVNYECNFSHKYIADICKKNKANLCFRTLMDINNFISAMMSIYLTQIVSQGE